MFMEKRKRVCAAALAAAVMIAFGGCAGNGGEQEQTNEQEQANEQVQEQHFAYRYASQEEGVSLLLGNDEYYNGLSQNELDYKMQKKDATLEEYKEYASGQVLEFSDEDKQAIDKGMEEVERIIRENDYDIPDIDEIVFVKTTQDEENGSTAYTHGTQIYFGDKMIEYLTSDEEETANLSICILWHEIFHCLTRCTPEFRAEMYELIHFTVQEENFEIPPSVYEYFISNPDVENHNSYATFIIDGEPVDCFTAWMSAKHFEKEGDSFFDYKVTALVPIDGSDTYYVEDDAENFYEIFGRNTDYVMDPEECMADNFSYAMTYGKDGREYENPEIIDGILEIVSP